LDRVRKTGRPLFVTTNGRTDAVVLSGEAYDALLEKSEMAASLKVLRRSGADIAAGRTRPAKAALKLIAKELGIEIER
jgi:prevent-host-death family protein